MKDGLRTSSVLFEAAGFDYMTKLLDGIGKEVTIFNFKYSYSLLKASEKFI